MKEEIIVVLDRSGSMGGIRMDMVGGLQEFVKKQQELGPAGFTLARFDTEYELVMAGNPLSDVKIDADILIPRGGTALFDAVGKTITSQGERFSKMPEADRPNRVMLLVITDGQENSSVEWTGANVRALLDRQISEWKWGVTFLGCGIDAIKGGASIGVNSGYALSSALTSKGIGSAFNAVGNSALVYRSTGAQIMYSQEERDDAADKSGTGFGSLLGSSNGA